MWVCLPFHLLSLCSEQESLALCLCLSLYSFENPCFALFDLPLSESEWKKFFVTFLFRWALGDLVSCSTVLLFLSQIQKGKAGFGRAFLRPKLPCYYFKRLQNIPVIIAISKLLDSMLSFSPTEFLFIVCRCLLDFRSNVEAKET